MPRLEGFPAAAQQGENACWACASRMIINWFERDSKNGKYASDTALAEAWSQKTKNATNANINIQQSAAALLGDLGYANNTDSAAMPTKEEIKDAIEEGTPLLAIVGGTRPSKGPNLEA